MASRCPMQARRLNRTMLVEGTFRLCYPPRHVRRLVQKTSSSSGQLGAQFVGESIGAQMFMCMMSGLRMHILRDPPAPDR